MNEDFVEDIETLPDDLFDTFESTIKCGEVFVNKGEFQYLCVYCSNLNGSQSLHNYYFHNIQEFSKHLFQSHQIFNFEPISTSNHSSKKANDKNSQQKQFILNDSDLIGLDNFVLNLDSLDSNENSDIDSKTVHSNNSINYFANYCPTDENKINNEDDDDDEKNRISSTTNDIGENISNSSQFVVSLNVDDNSGETNCITTISTTTSASLPTETNGKNFQAPPTEFDKSKKYTKNFLRESKHAMKKRCLLNCSFCKGKFQTAEKLEKHQYQKHQNDLDPEIPKGYFRCTICLKILSLTCGRKKHEDNHFKLRKRNTECNICNKLLSSPNSLKVHLRVHNQISDFKCAYCPASFKFSASLTQHQLSHTGERKFQCRHCNKKFLQNSHRKNHELLHSNKKPFICFCGKSFHRKDYLDSHSKKHQNNKTRPYSCPELNCNSTFTNEKYLKIHLSLHKKGTIYSCKYCDRQSIVKNIIERHEKTHFELKEKFECNLCPKKFESKNGLINHQRTKHPGNALLEYKCGQCNLIFLNHSDLQEHIRKICIINVKQYGCDLCSSRFDTKHGLKVHRAVQHQIIVNKQFLKTNAIDNNSINKNYNYHNDNDDECNHHSDILNNNKNNNEISELIQEIFS